MKQLIAISFLLLFLSANTAFGQLLKLPALIHHYHEHKGDKTDDDHGISFLDFLKKHYGEESAGTSSTKHDHQNLPFKTIDYNSIHTVIILPQLESPVTATPAVISQVNRISYNQQDYSSACLGTIWQPPRLG